MDRGGHGKPLLVRGFRKGLEDIFDHDAQLELDNVKSTLAGFDLGEVQHIVNESQEIVAAFLDSLGIFTLLIVQRRIQEQPSHAADAVHRRAKFMGDGGQELALRTIGDLSSVFGDEQRCLRLPALGNFQVELFVDTLELSRALGHAHLEFIAGLFQRFLSLFALSHVAANALYTDRLLISADQPGTHFKRHATVIFGDHLYFIGRPGSAYLFTHTHLSTAYEGLRRHYDSKVSPNHFVACIT